MVDYTEIYNKQGLGEGVRNVTSLIEGTGYSSNSLDPMVNSQEPASPKLNLNQALADADKPEKSIGQDLYEIGQFGVTAIPNVAMSALMSASDFFYKPMLWASEKVATTFGYDNMEGLYETKKDFLKDSGKEMSEFWSSPLPADGIGGLFNAGESYKRNEVVTNLAGDVVNIGLGTKFLLQSVNKGSKLYEAATAVMPESWANNVFIDANATANATRKLKATWQGLAASGFNPSSEISVAAEAARLAKVAGPEALKEAVYSTGGLYLSGYKHDELYPEDRTLGSMLMWDVGLPAAFVGGSMLSAANKAKVIANRSADFASVKLQGELNSYLKDMGMSDEIAKQQSQFTGMLNSYGLAGNAASDVIVQNEYIVKALQAIKEKAVNRAAGKQLTSEFVGETAHYFDGLILDAKARSSDALKKLVSKTIPENDRNYIYTTVNKASNLWSNSAQGTVSYSIAPKTMTELDSMLAKQSAKNKKIMSEAVDTKLSKKAKNKEDLGNAFTLADMEVSPKESGQRFFQLIDEDGITYDANDFYIRPSLEEGFAATIKTNNKAFNELSGGKYNDYFVDYLDKYFDKDGINYQVHSSPDGKVMVKSSTSGKELKKAALKEVSPTNVVGYDLGWGVLKKQYDSLLEPKKITTTSKGKTTSTIKYGYEILAENNPNGFAINLRDASHQQVAYLSKVADSIPEEAFNKLFKFTPDSLQEAKQNYASIYRKYEGSEIAFDDINLADLLEFEWVNKANQVFRKRAIINADKSIGWKFGKLSEDAVFEAISGMKNSYTTTDGIGNSHIMSAMDDWARYRHEAFDTTQLFKEKPNKFVLQETSETAGWTDQINDQIMERLAETKRLRENTLQYGSELDEKSIGYFQQMGIDANEPSFVNDVFAELVDRPQYKNGWIRSPLALAADSGKLGKMGRYLLFKDSYTEGNLALNAAVSYDNLVSPAITKAINNRLTRITELSKDVMASNESKSQFSKFVFQSNSGWRMKNAEPIPFGDGKYVFALDDKAIDVNSRIAERQAKLKQDFIGQQDFKFLPDPITGKPLVVDEQAKDLIVEYNHNAFDIWKSNNDLAQAAGRKGINFRPYWYPAKDLSDSVVKVICKEVNGESKPVLYVTGNTAKQAEAAAQEEMRISGFYRDSAYSVKTAEEVGLEKSFIREDITANAFDWVDASDPFYQILTDASKTNGIRLTQGNLFFNGNDVLRGTLNNFNHQYQLLSKRTRSALFNDEIDTARSMLTHRGEDARLYNEVNDYIAALRGGRFEPTTAKSKLYKAFDEIIDRGASVISDIRNMPRYRRSMVLATQYDENIRYTRDLFKSGQEVKDLYGMHGELMDQLGEAMKKLKITKRMHSKEIIAQVNKAATLGLLRLANFGYALMNIVSLPTVMPMARKMLARRPDETPREYQARIGAFGQVTDDGKDFAIDMLGGVSSTLNKAQQDPAWRRRVIAEAQENGVLSSQANLINEVLIDPAKTIVSKGGRKIMKAFTAIADKSEEMSRAIPYMYAYDMAERAGLERASCAAFATKFTNTVTGSYIASNRPALMSDAMGSLLGLFYTYNLNYLQNYVNAFLGGDKASVLTGLAMQTFMFGTESLPVVDEIEKRFLPTASGRDLYSTLVLSGADDKTARALMYGGLSSITGLNFASKGEIRPNVPGMTTPPIFSLTKNIATGIYDASKVIAANSNTSPRVLWEIMQTRMPVTAIKSGINLALGYKTNYKGDIVLDRKRIGNLQYNAAQLLSMQTVDEALNRDAIQRDYVKRAQQQEKRTGIRRNMEAGFRSGENPNDVIYRGVTDAIGAGLDPKNARQFVKAALARAMLSPIELKQQQLAKQKNKSASDVNLFNAVKLLGMGRDNDVTSPNANPYGLMGGDPSLY